MAAIDGEVAGGAGRDPTTVRSTLPQASGAATRAVRSVMRGIVEVRGPGLEISEGQVLILDGAISASRTDWHETCAIEASRIKT
jgi:heterodisulfide reductase subunit A-like polyferredoxin